MKQLGRAEYDALVKDAELLMSDRHGDKVLLRPDKKIVKLFRTKRLISSAQLYPYALRFKRNSEALNQRGIVSVNVEDIGYCPEIERHLVVYPLLEGETLREVLQNTNEEIIIDEYARFISELHEAGIYFRSLHMGNVLYRSGRNFALIDVADMSIGSSPLGVIKRLRNFRHLTRYKADVSRICHHGVQRFLDNYLAAGSLSPLSRWLLSRLIKIDCTTTGKGS